MSTGLGLFSIALGAAELLASRRIARALAAEGHAGLVKSFGAREVAAGASLLMAPAHSTRVWNRVAGDAMDLGALVLAARRAPKSKAVMGALAFVAGATVLDLVIAMGLDRRTGKAAPVRTGSDTLPARADGAGATSVEPTHVAHPEPPEVAVAPA